MRTPSGVLATDLKEVVLAKGKLVKDYDVMETILHDVKLAFRAEIRKVVRSAVTQLKKQYKQRSK